MRRIQLSRLALISMVALAAAHVLAGGFAGALGAVPGALLIITTTRYFGRQEYHRLPWLEVALAHLYAFWGAPTLFPEPFPANIKEAVVLQTMAAVAATSLIIFVMFPLGERVGTRVRNFVGRTLPVAAGPGMPFWVPVLLLFACLSSSGLLALWVPPEVQFATVIVGSSYPLLSYLVSKAPSLALPAASCIALAGLMSGMLEAVLVPFLAYALVVLVRYRKAPVRAAITFLVLFVILQPAKRVYRERAWTDEHVATDVIGTISNWARAIPQAWTRSGSELPGAYIAERLNDLGGIADTFTLVPDTLPYEYGESWAYLALAPIPRALMPEKPAIAERFNNRFNVGFGRQAEETTGSQTGSFPLIADGYWNFGWPGILLVAIILGLLTGILSSAVPLTTWGGLTLAVGLLTEFRPASFIVGQLASILPRWIGTAAACWIIWLVTGGSLAAGRQPQGISRAVTSRSISTT